MKYDQALIEYAKMIQIYSPDGLRVYNLLDKKIKDYALAENHERRDFWKEVMGEFQRKSFYTTYERYKHLETMHRDLRELFNVVSNRSVSTRTQEWFTILPQIEDYVGRMIDFRMEMDDEYLSSDDEAFECTQATLMFYNSVLSIKGMTDKDLFDYIPLLIWGLENLFIYGFYSREFDDFVMSRIITLFRKHRIAANAFVDLINRESMSGSAAFSHSTLFSGVRGEFECPVNIIDDVNTSLDIFSNSLIHGFTNGVFKTIDLDNAKYLRKNNPLYCIFRHYHYAEHLMIDEETTYVISRKVGSTVYNTCQTQLDTYCEDNVLFVLLSGAKSVLATEPGSAKRNIALWDVLAEEIERSLSLLLEAKVLSFEKSAYVKKFLKEGRRRIQDGLSG